MPRLTTIVCALLLFVMTTELTSAQTTRIRVESLDLGPHWYGAPIHDKRELVGNVVLFVLWGT